MLLPRKLSSGPGLTFARTGRTIGKPGFHDIGEAYFETLRDIQKLLMTRGSSLDKFGLPDPGQRIQEIDIERETFGHRSVELSLRADQMIASMNIEQATVYQVLYDAVTNMQRSTTVFYLDGKAGRGKSYVALALCTKLRSEGRIPVISGTSALSVTTYERGRTAHSTFGVPVSQVRLFLRRV
jgi:hypothetical protein